MKNMKKYLIFFFYLLICSCSDSPTETAEKWVEVKFRPQLDFTMIPMNTARSSDVNIIALVYQEDELYGFVPLENDELSMPL